MKKQKKIVDKEAFRDLASTVTEDGKRKWIYALQPYGFYYNIRTYLAYFYYAIFFIMPFIKVNGVPFLMLNVVEGKISLFGKIFWPQDFFVFAIATIAAVVAVVLFTITLGRIFCGWICPQTIFMEFAFRKIEWWIEGTPIQQKKRDSKKDRDYYVRKTLKHTIFLLFSFLIANTFLAYIIGVDELIKNISEPISEHIELLSGLMVFTLMFYSVFAFVREIVCTTICPYGRLQGVMSDKDTMQISYDYVRGEPRGKKAKIETKTEPEKEENALGDCVDCTLCVQVCPTGIDIRNGPQMECVGCTACIDVCDIVMEKVDRPKGLIRYASENEIKDKKPFSVTTRMKAYLSVLVILFIVMAGVIYNIRNIDTYIFRASGQLFQELENNKISNLYISKLVNKTFEDIAIELKVEGVPGEIKLIGSKDIILKAEQVNKATFFVVLDKKEVTKRSQQINIGVYHNKEKIQTIPITFLGPFN